MTGTNAPRTDPATEEVVIDSRDQLRSLLEHVPAMVLTVRLDGRIVFANRSHFGITAE